jgi:hypothetical protein
VEEVKKLIKEKIVLVDAKFVYDDLFALIESREFLEQFLVDFVKMINEQIDLVL